MILVKKDLAMQLNKKPLIAVYMITYNHEQYIKQAINSILNQQTKYSYKLFIGDDASSDNTKEICQVLESENPSKIKLFSHKKNLGASANAIFTFNKCYESGAKYVAMLEGDDFWTDPLKLQKQVDFLETNDDYNICFHEVDLLINDRLKENKGVTFKRYNEIESFPIGINTLLEKGNFIHTPSVVFRNNGLNKLPYEFSKSYVGDYFLYVYLLKNGGFIKKLDDVMAVYRMGSGIYSSLDSLEYQKNILIYQSCILSFLDNEHQKKIILSKQLNVINSHFSSLNKKNNYKEVGSELNFKQLIHLLLIKIKVFFNKIK